MLLTPAPGTRYHPDPAEHPDAVYVATYGPDPAGTPGSAICRVWARRVGADAVLVADVHTATPAATAHRIGAVLADHLNADTDADLTPEGRLQTARAALEAASLAYHEALAGYVADVQARLADLGERFELVAENVPDA